MSRERRVSRSVSSFQIQISLGFFSAGSLEVSGKSRLSSRRDIFCGGVGVPWNVNNICDGGIIVRWVGGEKKK